MTPTPVSHFEPAEFLTLAEAAKIAGRSYSWARDHAIMGRLDIRHSTAGGPVHVSAASLLRVIEAERKTAETQSQAGRGRRRAHLRLVVDNDKN